jgi:hypothetical protein
MASACHGLSLCVCTACHNVTARTTIGTTNTVPLQHHGTSTGCCQTHDSISAPNHGPLPTKTAHCTSSVVVMHNAPAMFTAPHNAAVSSDIATVLRPLFNSAVTIWLLLVIAALPSACCCHRASGLAADPLGRAQSRPTRGHRTWRSGWL